jgi:hypothetical protein
VTFDDFQNFLVGYTGGTPNWFNGDFDYNGVVNFADFNSYFLPGYALSNGPSGGSLSPADRAQFAAFATAAGEPLVLSSAATPAPEPSALGIVMFGTTGLLARRRKMKK